ncbi:O-antigen polymerase [Vibrio gigantis]
MKNYALIVTTLLTLLMCVVLSVEYPDLKLELAILFVASAIFIFSNTVGVFSPLYFFVTIMIFLGYHLKLVRLLVFDSPMTEPIGYFDFDLFGYSEIINLISIGLLSLIIGRFIQCLFHQYFLRYEHLNHPPLWFSNNQRISIIILTVISIVVFGVMITNNSAIGSTLLLPWPLPLIISFMGSYGIVILTFKFIEYKLALKEKASILFFIIFCVSIVSSIALVSRSVFVFIFIPILMYLLKRKVMSTSLLLNISLISFTLLIYILGLVTIARQNNFEVNAAYIFDLITVLPKGAEQLLYLITSRFVGLEGLMVFIANKSNSIDLFISLITEKILPGSYTVYSQVTGENSYLSYDRDSFLYYPFPGVMGFFLSSGNYIIYSLSIALLYFLFSLFEGIYSFLTKSKLITYYLSLTYAMLFLQFSVVPLQLLKNSILLLLFLLAFRFFERVSLKTHNN